MRKLLGLLVLLPSAGFASPNVEKYTERCWVKANLSTCVIVDTRTPDGFLNTRGIYNNEYGYTMKQRFVGAKGFVTWDSVTKSTYSFPYKVLANRSMMVTPHLVIDNIPLD
jgi:hypothetical protein